MSGLPCLACGHPDPDKQLNICGWVDSWNGMMEMISARASGPRKTPLLHKMFCHVAAERVYADIQGKIVTSFSIR